MPLTKPIITARETEKRATELLNEMLKLYFTGAPHLSPLTGQAVTFPVCDLFFNQASLPEAAPRPQLHIVYTDLRPIEQDYDQTNKIVTTENTLTIYVRVANQGATADAADHLCREVADNVKELFQSADRYALAQKNIRHPRITRGPTPLQTTGFQVRMILLRCQLRYFLKR